ncbi:WD40-repeat-containing domain protein [Aspergillus pseudonomiae]|uniref:WD40-repeat-containing domain protein n=1 Tax=Aspergillus pseudonomiae TaxID=1506151 RepID=A0A5N7DLK4_9EURO|nr:WD40-repeat-containing domain protein [Aspergillus pseudonomiae]KAE8407185.1 WD40-repeat-containing domain protein [Aspergillus pseudonomiae]
MASSITTKACEPIVSKTFPRDGLAVTACEMGSNYFVVAKEAALYVFDFADKSLTTLQEKGNVTWCLALREDKNRLVTGGAEGEVLIWNIRTKSVTRLLKGHTSTVRSLQIVNDTTLISGSRDSTICIWDMDSDEVDPKLVLKGHTETVRCLKVHGGVLVSGGNDGEARVWVIHTGQCLHVLKGHTGTLYDISFDGSRIVTGSLDSTIRVWDPQSGACLGVLSGHSGAVTRLCLQVDTLISADTVGTVKAWSLTTASGRTIAEEREGSVISLAADGENILVGNTNGSAYLVRRDSGPRKTLVAGADAVWNVGFTPFNRPLAIYFKGGDTQLDIF